ncbi:conserved exported hypothetical protein [Flavobacterium sp. 9AF]|uniref:hypothetical protein n=1 Tax=Flavobacterium sp. 9AF TaxID=2653142 RepID=UPI0012F092E4|nr:hypothetical protein [Flavobacterium sp. 9AF]VXA96524.1 conserved exported hypothetical protein [Flavobacterium sp. 9AF]
MKNSILFLLLLSIISCHTKETNDTNQKKELTIDATQTKKLENNKTIANLNKIKTDTVTFVSLNFDFDYSQLIFKKNSKEESVIYDLFQNKKNNFNRGDILEIKTKLDTIYIAGDGETLDYSDWLIEVRRIKEGKLTLYKNSNRPPLKYFLTEENDFSETYLNFIYSSVEYYLANSKKELVLTTIDNKNNSIIFSIENSVRDNKNYLMIGLSNDLEDHLATFQWLFIDIENNTIYEYDLPNDELILFE